MNWHNEIHTIHFSSRIMISRQATSALLRRFAGDQSGSYVILSALMMPVLVGAAGFGTEVGWWYYKHKHMQSAADSGAVSAATAGSNLTAEANAITSSYGYGNGVNNVTVAVIMKFIRACEVRIDILLAEHLFSLLEKRIVSKG